MSRIVLDCKYNLRDFNFNVVKFYKYKKSVKQLQEYYDDIYTAGAFEAVKIVERVKNTAEGTSKGSFGIPSGPVLPNVEAANEIRSELSTEIEKEFRKKNFLERSTNFEVFLKKCLSYVSVELILDDFDEIDIEDNNVRFEYIGNFIETIKSMNRDLRNYSENSRVILLLREDYINKLSSRKPNIQKTLSDTVVELNWTDRSNKNDLMNLVVNKIKNSNACLSKYEIHEVRDKFFPEFDKSSQGNFDSALDMIMSYTFYRPRDFVVYIDTIIKSFGNSTSISESMVIDCAAEFSRKFIGELENEIGSHYSPEYVELLTETLRKQNKTKFKSANYALEMVSKEVFSNDKEANRALDILFQFSVIGNYRLSSKKNSAGMKIPIYTFQFREPGKITIDHTSRLIVHKGVIKGLNIV